MTASQKKQNSFRPSSQQTLLLQASLYPQKDAFNAWQCWRASVDFENLDHGSFRLLPLLVHNLGPSIAEDPLYARIKGIARHFWYRNQLFSHLMAPILSELQSRSVKILLLKGAALATTYYPKPALRPMADLDILIRPRDLPATLDLLRANGWDPICFPDYAALGTSYLSFATSHGFRHSKERELDLHWRLLPKCPTLACDEGFWQRAVPMTLQGVDCHTLDPTDLLFHILLHGAGWNDVPSIRWVADAWMVLARASSIDWNRLVEEGRRHGLVPALRETLNFLATDFNIPVPDRIRTHLDTESGSPAQEREFQIEQIPLQKRSVAQELWLAYRSSQRWAKREQRTAGPLNYLRVLQHTAKRQYLSELWLYALKKGLERLRESP